LIAWPPDGLPCVLPIAARRAPGGAVLRRRGLRRRGRAARWRARPGCRPLATDYQTTNSAEFFAVAYTDFIAHTYDLPSRRELDEEGIVEDVFALIRELDQRAGS